MISQMSLLKTQTAPFHLQSLNLSVIKFIETDSKSGGFQGLVGKGLGSRLMGVDLQFCKIKEL